MFVATHRHNADERRVRQTNLKVMRVTVAFVTRLFPGRWLAADDSTKVVKCEASSVASAWLSVETPLLL